MTGAAARPRKKTAAHQGFKKVAGGIAKQYERKGKSPKEAQRIAGAVLAKKTREASPAAKKKNPFLKRVGGKSKR